MQIMRAKITSCTPLPLNYLEEEEIQRRFSPTRISKLIEKVCKITDIALPTSVKIVLLENFYQYLVRKFQESNVYTGDLVSMV